MHKSKPRAHLSSEDECEEESEDEDGFLGVPAGHQSPCELQIMENEEYEFEEEEEEEEKEEEEVPQSTSSTSIPAYRIMSIWVTTQYIGIWKMAHRRGYHINTLTQDPGRKALLMRQEIDYKNNLPLPMSCVLEKEALEILQNTFQDYKHKLGPNHNLTKEIEEAVEKLRAQVVAKFGNTQIVGHKGLLGSILGWGRALASLLGLGNFVSTTSAEKVLPKHFVIEGQTEEHQESISLG